MEISSTSQDIPKLNLKGYIIQYAIAFTATIHMLSSSMVFGWSSPSIPILLSENSPIPVTKSQSSWIVSLLIVGVLASIPYAWITDKYGRKFILLLSSLPLVIAWILIVFATSVEMLYAARILSGLTMIGSMFCPIYLGEIASDKIRGSIGTLFIVMSKVGVLYVYAIGSYVSISVMAIYGLIPSIVFLLLFIWCPESPYYLVKKNRLDDAYRTLLTLRGIDTPNDMEKSMVKNELNKIDESIKNSLIYKGTYAELFNKMNRKSLIIVMGLESGQQLTGSFIITAYAQMIFDDIGSHLNASEASILLAIVQLLSSVIALSFVDRWGRRPLLILSALGVTTCHITVAIYFNLNKKFNLIDDSQIVLRWIPVIAIMCFIIFYNIGLSTVPFAIMSEIFPSHIKAKALTVFTFGNATLLFTITNIYQRIADDLGNDVIFFIFGMCTFLTFIFIWFVVPETKGKSLDEIVNELHSKKIPTNNNINNNNNNNTASNL